MFLDDRKMQKIRDYLSSPSGQNALKALGPLGSMKDEEVLKQVWRIIPEDRLPEGIKEDLGIPKKSKGFSYEKEPPGFFGERPESEREKRILEQIRNMGLEAEEN